MGRSEVTDPENGLWVSTLVRRQGSQVSMRVARGSARRSYFLPLTKKRRETVLYLPTKERAYKTLRPGM